MNKPKFKTGDIYITDNWSTGAKIVQFLSTCNTCWEHLWLFLFNKDKLNSKRPEGYHYGMVLDPDTVIEQQGAVEIKDINKIFKKEVYIYRKMGLTEYDKNILLIEAIGDLNEGYGILECFGKLLAWLTGIKYFVRWLDMKDRSICVVRIGEWFKGLDSFGVSHPSYLKANMKEKYLDTNPKWKLIYEQKEGIK